MEKIHKFLILLSFFVFLFFSTPAESASSIVPNDGPGVFFVFANGQILILDPVAKKFIKQMTNFSEPEFPNGVPFPNYCTGNPFQGTWNKVTLGVGSSTLFATAQYQISENRLVNLTDAIYVVSGPSGPIVKRVKSPGQPNNVYFIPYAGSVWTHNDVDGSFNVIQASSPFNVYDQTVLNNLTVSSGYGDLMYDDALNGAAYKTNINSQGIYLYYDLFHPEYSIDSLPFIKLNGKLLGNQTIRCSGTRSSVFSQNSRTIFVSCIARNFAPAGVIEYNPRSNKIVNYFNFTADTLVITPTQDFLIGVNSKDAKLHLVKLSGSTSEEYSYVPLPKYSYPSEIVFFESGDSYKLYISLANDSRIASLSMSQVNCGQFPCQPDNLYTFLQFFEMGRHGMGIKDSSGLYRRSITAGSDYICTVAYSSNAISCYDTTTSLQSGLSGVFNLTNVENPQLIVFVKGVFTGERTENIDTRINCTAVPMNFTYPKSSAMTNKINNAYSLFMMIVVSLGFLFIV